MKQFTTLLICAVCFFSMKAQPDFTNSSFSNDDGSQFLHSFEGETSDSARVYLQIDFEDGNISYSEISEFGLSHNISIVFPRKNTMATVKAIAFNIEGTRQTDVLAYIEPISTSQDALIGENIGEYEKPLKNDYLLLSTETEIPKEKDAIILGPEGEVVWAETLPNSNEFIDCNAINYQNGYVVITDCHSITVKKLDGSEQKTYQFEVDSLAGANSFFHDKAIINRDGNIVSLYAHETIVDRSLVGGSEQTELVSDGIVEFDFASGEIVNIYTPMRTGLCQYFQTLNKGGKYAAVFGDAIENYRLASAIVQDFDKTYFLTMDSGAYFPQGGITKVNIKSGLCAIDDSFIAPNSDGFIFYEDDHFVYPRSFSVLPDGNFFMLTNYPDTTIVINEYPVENDTITAINGNGITTRGLKFWLDFGYEGIYVMFYTIDEYNLPAEAYTEMGSAIWLPGDEMLSYSPTDKTLYQITDESNITGALQFTETISPVALIEDFEIIPPEVTIMNIDTLVCNDKMEMYELEGMPKGGYFSGEAITNGNIFDPTGLDAGQIYTITYNYGPYSASFEIEVDNCVSVNELMQMGGLDSDILPNPVTTDKAMLKYQMVEPGDVLLTIVNLNGQLIKNLSLGFRSAGLTAEMINVSDLPSGTYIYKLISGNMLSSSRFNIIK